MHLYLWCICHLCLWTGLVGLVYGCLCQAGKDVLEAEEMQASLGAMLNGLFPSCLVWAVPDVRTKSIHRREGPSISKNSHSGTDVTNVCVHWEQSQKCQLKAGEGFVHSATPLHKWCLSFGRFAIWLFPVFLLEDLSDDTPHKIPTVKVTYYCPNSLW